MLTPLNAQFPILVTDSGIVISFSVVQCENAPLPMVVTESGIVTEVRLLQFENEYSPMLFTESGIVMELSLTQLVNIESLIEVIDLPRSISSNPEHLKRFYCLQC